MTIDIPRLVADWRANPPIKGQLVDYAGRYCAQGDVLRRAGYSDEQLRAMEEYDADRKTAEVLDISTGHSVLLRVVNDSPYARPADVLARPHLLLGNQAPRVLAFWSHLDALTGSDWATLVAEMTRKVDDDCWHAACTAAKDAASAMAGAMAYYLVLATVWCTLSSTRRHSAGWRSALIALTAISHATNEIQGAEILRANGRPYIFLPLCGIEDPATLDAGHP